MKKIILVALWIVPCLASVPQAEMKTTKIRQNKEHLEQAQREAQKLPDELVDCLLDHSPELVKEYINYLEYSASVGEVKPKTLFLHGPSGVGKTETAIALAIKAKMPYTLIKASDFGTTFQNSAKLQIKDKFDSIIHADTPHVIIIDEFMRLVENYNDARGTHEDNTTATAVWDLLDQCAKAKNILVIATANGIERCPEMVRTRFGSNRFVEFKMPDKQVRKKILQLLMKKFSCSETVLNQVVEATEGISPRDLRAMLELVELKMACKNKEKAYVAFDDFKNEIERCKASGTGFYGEVAKMMHNAKEELVNAPIDTSWKLADSFWKVTTGISAVAAGTAYVIGKCAQKTAETVAPVAGEAAKKTVEHAPAVARTVVESTGDTVATMFSLLQQLSSK